MYIYIDVRIYIYIYRLLNFTKCYAVFFVCKIMLKLCVLNVKTTLTINPN